MTAATVNDTVARDAFVADLTEAAFEVVSRHGVEGSSVDHEVELWKALGRVVRGRPQGRKGLVAELTDAAYRVALGHGFREPFVDVELDLWQALCLAVRRNRPAAV
jgi:hypothetical protein